MAKRKIKEMVDDHKILYFVSGKYFKTKEEAEEYIEFGNIVRVEKLDLPTWDQTQQSLKKNNHICFRFETPNNYKCALIIEKDKGKISVLGINAACNEWDLTKENYNEARRLCVKLFKGKSKWRFM